MNKYEFTARGKRWNDEDEIYTIESDTPQNALTKIRILHGEDAYRRIYMCYDCDNHESVRSLFSYGMLREQLIRDYGRKYYYHIKKVERRKYLENLRERG